MDASEFLADKFYGWVVEGDIDHPPAGAITPVWRYKSQPPTTYKKRNGEMGVIEDPGWHYPDYVIMNGFSGVDIFGPDSKNRRDRAYFWQGFYQAPKNRRQRFIRNVYHGRAMGYPWLDVLAWSWKYRNMGKKFDRRRIRK